MSHGCYELVPLNVIPLAMVNGQSGDELRTDDELCMLI
jgi:hypothetical protein